MSSMNMNTMLGGRSFASANATVDDGAWKHPSGAEYYRDRLALMTTTDMTADDIHQLGLAEVDRIHDEMRTIMAQVGFEGSLAEFFVFLREDPQFYYPDTDAGREAYLAEAVRLIDVMGERLPEAFGILPEAELVVKRVEAFRGTLGDSAGRSVRGAALAP